MKILFVCLGNICRSPAAEGVMKRLLENENLAHKVQCDSAGTNGLHNGELPDSRMRENAHKRGLDLTSRSRQITHEDLASFDYIITMDESNLRNVKKLDPENLYSHKILPLTQFGTLGHDHVPDPYYGGEKGFELVLDLLEDACAGFLKQIKSQLK